LDCIADCYFFKAFRLFNPYPPAEFIREDVLPALGLSIGEAADQLGVNRVTLSRVLNGCLRRAILLLPVASRMIV
jgi:plasmid maintenance system antidote protein VapI